MSVRRLCSLFPLVMLLGTGCAGSAAHHPSPAKADPLARVAAVHGGAGPWAVMGYRMGVYALQQLKLPAGSFALEVIHHTPQKVQYACVADGAAAATGASVGKLNLSLVEVLGPEDVVTRFRNRDTGETLALRPSPRFVQRYLDVPREKLAEAGAEVLTLPDAEVFEVVTAL
ncbi:FmdE family protein [Myxococcus sp. Y35]|uniref:FmdE family protein n=1 Tax=Pseudomyxococcus flavus TaxID=3115648 RepID=UPI003CF68BDF